MTERRDGIGPFLRLALIIGALAMLLVGGCTVWTLWYGFFSGEYLAEIVPIFGVPIGLVQLGLLALLRRNARHRPSALGRLAGGVAVTTGISLLFYSGVASVGVFSDPAAQVVPGVIVIVTGLASGLALLILGVRDLFRPSQDSYTHALEDDR